MTEIKNDGSNEDPNVLHNEFTIKMVNYRKWNSIFEYSLLFSTLCYSVGTAWNNSIIECQPNDIICNFSWCFYLFFTCLLFLVAATQIGILFYSMHSLLKHSKECEGQNPHILYR